MFDAHCHTDCSDGNITIEDRMDMIRSLGYSAATITDHDFISTEQIRRARSAARELPYIPGIELTLMHQDLVVHVLGYFVDPEHAGLQAHLRRVQDRDRTITEQLLERYREHGASFHIEDLEADSLHTFYSMQLVKRLAREVFDNDAPNLIKTFQSYLGQLGLTYAQMAPWPVEEGIRMIREAGGIAVLAHPGGREDAVMRQLGFLIHDAELIEQYASWGLVGVETRTPVHTPQETTYYEQIAREKGLLMTSGSDCHGDDPYLGPALMGQSVDLYDHLYEDMLDVYRQECDR